MIMKKLLLAFPILLFTINAFGQEFSQYNTGTVYESFENPSVRSFIPDSSRRFAFNFFLPNFGTKFFVNGNSQVALKSRAFLGTYVPTNLTEEQGRTNRFALHANIYWGMFKFYNSLMGDVEMGISAQSRAEGRGVFTDESALLYNGVNAFKKSSYDNIFNDDAFYQTYHQLSFTYRERINPRIALGFKLSALFGIQYQSVDVKQSHLELDKPNDLAILSMQGKYINNYIPGTFNTRDYLPTLRNPGASISLGTSIKTRDAFNLQFNLKDLGFIHWSNRSYIYNFDGTDTIPGLSTSRRERNIYDAQKNITHTNRVGGPFVTHTNAKIEVSANKVYALDYDNVLKYAPTLILSKELFYQTYTAALVNPILYKNYTVSLVTSYDSYRIFNLGGQFMVKSPNAEFFIGTERLVPTGRLAFAAAKNDGQINYQGAYSGFDVYMGVSFKFGSVIEHPLNASFIPMNQKKGFFTRLYNRLFKRED